MAKKPGNYYPVNQRILFNLPNYDLGELPAFENIKTVLAVDPGTTNLAAALLLMSSAQHRIETTKFEIPAFKKTYSKVAYLERAIKAWAEQHLGRFGILKVDLLVKESIAHGYAGGVADAGRVQHMLENLAATNRIPFVDVNPAAMRAYLGSKSKSDTKLAVYKKFHVEFDSEDECDVYAIARTGLALVSGEYKPKTKK